MSDKSSIIINSTNQAGNEKSMSVGYINPDATPSEMIQFAQAINNLTQNVYRGTTLVEKTELVVKPENPVTLDESTFSFATIKTATDSTSAIFMLNNQYAGFNLDNLPKVIKNTTQTFARIISNRDTDYGENGVTLVQIAYDARASELTEEKVYDAWGNLIAETGEIVVQIPETTQYAAKTLTITVTA